MKTFRKLVSLIPALLVWLIFSIIFWGWIFTMLTDTAAANKITLCADVDDLKDVQLAVALEKEMPAPIRMAKVHPFSYAMFDTDVLKKSDLLIIRKEDYQLYRDWFSPLPKCLLTGPYTYYYENGIPMGIRVYDASTGRGCGRNFIGYSAGSRGGEDCYLFFGAMSMHSTASVHSLDNCAETTALFLLSLD